MPLTLQFSLVTSQKALQYLKQEYAKAKENTVKLAEAAGIEVLYHTEIAMIIKGKSGIFERIQIINSETSEKRS